MLGLVSTPPTTRGAPSRGLVATDGRLSIAARSCLLAGIQRYAERSDGAEADKNFKLDCPTTSRDRVNVVQTGKTELTVL